MAVYRKKLVDKDGNTIIPAVGDIYGTVYTATLSNATAGGRADYEFTPDTPVENNKVYAVMFPEPTVNNATIILGDGVVSGSILVPPVAATDSPNYELLTTDMINNTEPLLLMYSGVQWVCLNQKKKVSTADLEDKAVTSDKIDWTKLQKYYKACSQVNPFNIPTAWNAVTPSGWTLTFPTNSGEIYKVEIVTGYLCWNGENLTELDMHVQYSGAESISRASSTMTGTYGGGVSIGRIASGILKATGNSMTVKAGIASSSTGNYARIDKGYILAERIA